MRESPNAENHAILQQRGAVLDYNDPYFSRKCHKRGHLNTRA